MRKPLSVVFVLGLLSPLVSVPASALTLEEALSAAYLGNPQLEAGRVGLRSSDELVPQALSGWRPRVEVSGQIGLSHSEAKQSGVSIETTSRPRSAGITISQPLIDFQTGKQIRAAEKKVLAGRQNLLSVEQDVLLKTTEIYLNVLQDQAIVQLNRNNEQVLERQLAATQDRFRVGELTRTDVSQAQSRLAGAVAKRIAAESRLSSSQATFERIVGLVPVNLVTPSLPQVLPDSREQAISEANSSQPDVLEAQLVAEAGVDAVKGAQGALLPSVSLDGSWRESWSDGKTGNAQISANVKVPLYQSGAEYSRLRQSKHEAGKARIMVDLARQKARETAIQSWDNWKSTQAKIASITAQIESSKVALEGVQREAQVGSRTILDVLDAEQELLNARVDLVGAQRDELMAAYTLTASVGRLTAASLGLAVEIYDPVQHYNAVRDKWIGSSKDADTDYMRKEAVPLTSVPQLP